MTRRTKATTIKKATVLTAVAGTLLATRPTRQVLQTLTRRCTGGNW